MTYHEPSARHLLASAGRGAYHELVAPLRQAPRPPHSIVYRVPSADGSPAAFVKVYRPGERAWHFLLRPSKAWSEGFNLRRLARWGVPAVRVLAVGCRRSWRGVEDAVLVTEAWPNGQMLSALATNEWPALPAVNRRRHPEALTARPGQRTPEQQADQRAIGRLVASAVRSMHARHFYHMDLKWRNMLVRRRDGGGWQIAILDCPRGYRTWSLAHQRHGRARDLAMLDQTARVYLSRTDRLRWLLDYLGQNRLTPSARRLMAQVLAATDRMDERWARRH